MNDTRCGCVDPGTAAHVVVARGHSRLGGPCRWPGCDRLVLPGDPIVKVDTGERGPGVTLSTGNGPGAWCHAFHVDDPAD